MSDCKLVKDGGGWFHYEGDDVGSAEGEHFHESGWLLARGLDSAWLACNTMTDREEPLEGATTLDEAKAALKAMVLGFFGEDPHGWVSVDDRMPTKKEQDDAWGEFEVWTKFNNRHFAGLTDGEWRSCTKANNPRGVTHWRVPTPGPQTSTAPEWVTVDYEDSRSFPRCDDPWDPDTGRHVQVLARDADGAEFLASMDEEYEGDDTGWAVDGVVGHVSVVAWLRGSERRTPGPQTSTGGE